MVDKNRSKCYSNGVTKRATNEEVRHLAMHTSEIKHLITGKYETESALARSLGWPRQRLNKITTGVRLPTIEEINDLSLALGVSIETLVHIFLPVKSPNG